MFALWRWLTGRWPASDQGGHYGEQVPAEAIALRCFGLLFMVVTILSTLTIEPDPGLHGKGMTALAGLVLLVGGAIMAQVGGREAPPRRVLLALTAVTLGSVALAIAQPKGSWAVGVYYVAIIAALRFDRLRGSLILAAALAPFIIGAASEGHVTSALLIASGVIPWFLMMRLLRVVHTQREELDASRGAEAEAAAAAERGRLAREMHDVLAHSLSALALQLESTRLLARDRRIDGQLAEAIDKAHHLAAGGLQEARRAIATTRGDELPGPERIGALADSFGEQSGLPVDLQVSGEPRELAPEARLAVYRTAQEALTNVRRHATPERVEVRLDYLLESTVLVVEDHVPDGTPPPVGLGLNGSGYGLTGMRERAELLGGELLAAPTAGGFRVELRLPA